MSTDCDRYWPHIGHIHPELPEAERLLLVALIEELVQHPVRPDPAEVEGLQRVGDVGDVQKHLQPRALVLPQHLLGVRLVLARPRHRRR